MNVRDLTIGELIDLLGQLAVMAPQLQAQLEQVQRSQGARQPPIIQTENGLDDWIPLKEWCQRMPWPEKESQLRWWVFNAEHNGFNRVFSKVGNRILISKKAFGEWIASNGRVDIPAAAKPAARPQRKTIKHR